MTNTFFKRLVASILSFSLLFGSASPVFAAGMDTLMNDMFNDVLVNYTPSGAYETQMGGVITGPSLYARSKTSSIQLYNLQLPKVRGRGCNIDIFGGSFSFISKEQLVNFLRQIAANAVPYAFNLALDALCNSCEKHMAKLQALANQWNLSNLNSCQAAQALVKDIDKEFGLTESLKPIGDSIGQTLGRFSDKLAASQNETGMPSTELLYDSNRTEIKKELEGNVTWQILNGSSFAASFRSSYGNDLNVNEVLMSFLGTVVARYPKADAPPDASKDIEIIALPPLITNIKEFMQSGKVDLYTCGGDTDIDQCLYPTKNPNQVQITGFSQYTETILLSIVNKISDRSDVAFSTFTSAEKAFIERAPGSVASHLVRLAANKGTAKAYTKMVSDYIALSVTTSFIDEVITNFSIASVDSKRQAIKAKMIENLRQRRAEVEAQINTISTQMVAAQSTMELASYMRKSMLAGGTAPLAR